ncbi:MAG: MFS transporter [Myxococcales bacterium]|nr:MFS transporter [Myxococcales bacterium]
MVFASSSQVMIVVPIMPRIGEALEIPEALYGSLISGFAAALALFALIIGPVSDRIGRRRVLLLGTGALTVILALHVFAVSYPALLALRILAGAGAGVLSGAAVSYVGDYFPYSRRGWANGVVMTGFAFGQILAIPLGTLLADARGFQAPFVAFAAPMVVAFALILLAVPQPDVRLETAPLRAAEALRGYLELLRDRVIAGAAVTYFLMFGATSTLFVYYPTWLETQLHARPRDIAAMFAIGGVIGVLSGPIAGRVSDRVGRKPVLISACVGFFALSLALPYTVREVFSAHVAFCVAMVLYAARLSPLQALLTALAPEQKRGRLLSLTVAVGQLGSAAGAAAVGPLYAWSGYATNTALTAAAMALAGLVVWRVLPEPARDVA